MTKELLRKRQSVQTAFRWGVKREPYPAHSGSLEFLRYERRVWKDGIKNTNRFTVGFIRAMGAQHFFRGC